MFDAIDPVYVFYATLVGAVLAIAETIYLLTFTAAEYRSNVNRRLAELGKGAGHKEAVLSLRRERGISEFGSNFQVGSWFNRLMLQSGLKMSISKFALIATACGLAALGIALVRLNLIVSIFCGAVFGCLAPLLFLLFMRRRRRNKFTDQFAEALDIIVRSLRAGHPVPAAIKMVAREMSDPAGSEFGMAEDEITFGLDVETAMRNLMDRVGQEDLPLFVTSVAIQTSSGGNLTEILDNLTQVIRLRVKMRRKIKALSSEGRTSAVILSAVPIVLFIVINWMSPGFYGANWGHPWMVWGLSIAGVWMLIGNLVMHKMINFRF